MQCFDISECTEQAKHKSANEIYLLHSDAMFILCVYFIFTSLEAMHLFFATYTHFILYKLFIGKLQF